MTGIFYVMFKDIDSMDSTFNPNPDIGEATLFSIELRLEKTGLQGFLPGLKKTCCTTTEDG